MRMLLIALLTCLAFFGLVDNGFSYCEDYCLVVSLNSHFIWHRSIFSEFDAEFDAEFDIRSLLQPGVHSTVADVLMYLITKSRLSRLIVIDE